MHIRNVDFAGDGNTLAAAVVGDRTAVEVVGNYRTAGSCTPVLEERTNLVASSLDVHNAAAAVAAAGFGILIAAVGEPDRTLGCSAECSAEKLEFLFEIRIKDNIPGMDAQEDEEGLLEEGRPDQREAGKRGEVSGDCGGDGAQESSSLLEGACPDHVWRLSCLFIVCLFQGDVSVENLVFEEKKITETSCILTHTRTKRQGLNQYKLEY